MEQGTHKEDTFHQQVQHAIEISINKLLILPYSREIRVDMRINFCLGYVLTGSWEYFDANGNLFKTEFVADKDGYRPR